MLVFHLILPILISYVYYRNLLWRILKILKQMLKYVMINSSEMITSLSLDSHRNEFNIFNRKTSISKSKSIIFITCSIFIPSIWSLDNINSNNTFINNNINTSVFISNHYTSSFLSCITRISKRNQTTRILSSYLVWTWKKSTN